MNNSFFVKDSKEADELIKLDFPAQLYTSPEDCEVYLDHCNRYNMKWLPGSYGTIVHQKFHEYFKHIPVRNDDEYEIQQKLICRKGLDTDYHVNGVDLPIDHINLLQSKQDKDIYIVTSSPYDSLSMNVIKSLEKYPYGAYVIHPNLLDYHGFVGRFDERLRHPLYDINYAFTNASVEQMFEIDKQIYKDIDGVFPPFFTIRRVL